MPSEQTIMTPVHNKFGTLFIALSCFLFLLPVTALAQFSDSVHYYAGLTSSGSFNSTNTTKSYLFSDMLKLGIKRNDISLHSTNSWLYGEQQRKLSNNDYTSTLDFNLYKTLPHFYYWGLANYTSSYSLKINSQYQGGLGIACNILDRKDARMNLSDGVLYEYSNITLHDTGHNVYYTWRNSLRLSFRFLLWEKLALTTTTFYQHSFTSGSDYIIRSDNTIGLKIRKWFSLSTAIIYNRFNRTQKENTLVSYGLTLEKFF